MSPSQFSLTLTRLRLNSTDANHQLCTRSPHLNKSDDKKSSKIYLSYAKIHFSHCSGSDTCQRQSMLIVFWNAFETKKAHNFCYRHWISRHFYVTFNLRSTISIFTMPQYCYTAPKIHFSPSPLLTSFPPCLIVASCCHAFCRSAQQP